MLRALLICLFTMWSAASMADPLLGKYQDMDKVGSSRVSVAMFNIYDAALYAPDGNYKRGKPFALELTYLRHIAAKSIVDQTISEIRSQGFNETLRLLDWRKKMIAFFPDVTPGMKLTGLSSGTGQVIFLKDGIVIGRINDREFEKHFFDIWLGSKTRSPHIRQELLGG